MPLHTNGLLNKIDLIKGTEEIHPSFSRRGRTASASEYATLRHPAELLPTDALAVYPYSPSTCLCRDYDHRNYPALAHEEPLNY